MKKFSIYIIIIIIISCLLLLIFNKDKDNSQEELNVLNWSSYIPDSVIKEFEDKYNIKVNYSTYSSNEELLAKVNNVKEGTYDLVFPSDYMVEIMRNKDLLEKLDKSNLHNINNLNSEFLGLYYDKDNTYSLPFISANVVISVNKKNIDDSISSYNDLLNSKYKNNIVLVDDSRIVIGIALKALGYDINTTDQNELNEALNWLKKLKPNIKAYDSDSPKNFLITEEADIGVIWNAEAAIASMSDNNIETVYPDEGGIMSIDNYVILKGSKNTDNAYKFIDYLMDENVMKKIIESYPYKSVNKNTDLILDSKFMNNKAVNISNEYIEKSSFVKNVGENIKLYDNVWVRLK